MESIPHDEDEGHKRKREIIAEIEVLEQQNRNKLTPADRQNRLAQITELKKQLRIINDFLKSKIIERNSNIAQLRSELDEAYEENSRLRDYVKRLEEEITTLKNKV